MATWLSQHPNVFFSAIKEPHHFDTDHKPGIKDLASYERLFKDAGDAHLQVGEASVRYLNSDMAVRNILDYSPEAKFIVMVRNPVEMAASLHEQYVFTLNEDVESFEKAWRLQSARAQGQNIPLRCVDPKHLQYGSYCSLGRQLERLFGAVSPSRVRIVFMEDLNTSAGEVYQSLLEFLELPAWQPDSFVRLNAAKQWKNKLLATLVTLAVRAKIAMGLRAKSFGVGTAISKWNRIERPRATLTPEMRTILEDYFREDILLLSRLTGRDLGHWFQSSRSFQRSDAQA